MTGTDRDEARERARRRLEAREARLRKEEHPHRLGVRGSTASRHARPARTSSDVAPSTSPGAGVFAAVSGLVHAVGPKRIALVAAALILFVLAIIGVRSCAGCAASSEPSTDAPVPEPQQAAKDPIDQAALVAVLGDDLAAQLIQAAETDENAAWVAAHPQDYLVDGDAVQRKLLKLAATEPEAVAFVRTFPSAYPAETAGVCGEVEQGSVPRLYQWDERWGSTVYSSTTFALTGCCPTSLSMVYQGLTGKSDLSPYDMGKRASEGGYETAFDGTDATFLVNEAASLGLTCESVGADEASLRAALADGGVVICNVGPGDFTEAGHFFVITGIDDEGGLTINDPYSAERSNRTWDVGTVLGQTMALYGYRMA